jgi:hypothetical protein
MANGLDKKLERLFAKRKLSTSTTSTDLNDTITTPTEALQNMFPSPSFIRPKSTRMIARDEVLVTASQQPAKRTQSLPETHLPRRFSTAHSHKPSSASTSRLDLDESSARPTSLTRRRDVIICDLQEFKFPVPPTHSGETSPKSISSSAISPREIPAPDGKGEQPQQRRDLLPPRADTPPGSDPEDTPKHGWTNKELPALPHADIPTPGPSPDMAPVADSQLAELPADEILDSTSYKHIQGQLDGARPLRKAASHSVLTPPSYQDGASTILQEPTFHDFLGLSDDDIAEAMPEPLSLPPQQGLPPTPPATASIFSIPSSRGGSSLLTLTPPYATRPATAAAFEAARIAARYNFDLVYVVNLWPDTTYSATSPSNQPSWMSDDTASTPQSALSDSPTLPIVHARTGLTGRLLAAYGLSSVKSPFRISAAVHAKILRSNGWIEYRNQDVRTDEFARGYACAFHTSQYGRRASADSTTPPSSRRPQDRELIDRGIVFAAYRKPSEDGITAGVGLSPVELKAVHHDAEMLVDMLIDIHASHRLRQPVARGAQMDETGPMPVHRGEEFV